MWVAREGDLCSENTTPPGMGKDAAIHLLPEYLPPGPHGPWRLSTIIPEDPGSRADLGPRLYVQAPVLLL